MLISVQISYFCTRKLKNINDKQKLDESNILLETIIEGVQEVKGKDMTILDLRNIETAVCKYFVICTGTSNIHVSSISDNVRKLCLKRIK